MFVRDWVMRVALVCALGAPSVALAGTTGGGMFGGAGVSCGGGGGGGSGEAVDVRDHGAACDGVTDDTTAIQSALNANKHVYIPIGTCVSDTLNIAFDNAVISGAGPLSTLEFKAGETSSALISAGTHPLSLQFVRLYGGHATSCKSGCSTANNRDGVRMPSQVDAFVSQVIVSGFDGEAITFTDVARDRLPHVVISDSTFENSGTCLELIADNAEYIKVNDISAVGCTVGVKISSGNVNLTHSQIVDNGTGVYVFGTGISNNAHGAIVGNLINHSLTWSLRVEDVTLGETFSGNVIIEGPIWLDTSSGVMIQGGILDVQSYCLEGGGRNVIRDNHVKTSLANTVTHNCNGSTDNTLVLDNPKPDGTYLNSFTTIHYETLIFSTMDMGGVGTALPGVTTQLGTFFVPPSEEWTIRSVGGRLTVGTATGTGAFGFSDGTNTCVCAISCTTANYSQFTCTTGAGNGCVWNGGVSGLAVAINWGQGGDVCETAQPLAKSFSVLGRKRRLTP